MFRRARLYCLAVLERLEIALFTRKCSIGAASYKGPFVNLVFLECIDRNLTSYEVNKNLRKFWFATPFTKDGKSHGGIVDQYNRKTIISVENYFPFVKSRIKVVKEETREIILTPIEVATEDIAAQLCKLRSAMNDRSVMLLHMVVQSCVATAVQAGPVEVAKVFLRSTFNCKYYKHYISALVLERKKYIQITRERN